MAVEDIRPDVYHGVVFDLWRTGRRYGLARGATPSHARPNGTAWKVAQGRDPSKRLGFAKRHPERL